jgi:hypothetical protein
MAHNFLKRFLNGSEIEKSQFLNALQDAGLGMWKGGVGITAARQAAGGSEGVAGKVIEVVSGDTVIVRLADGKDVRLSLARCRSYSCSGTVPFEMNALLWSGMWYAGRSTHHLPPVFMLPG